MPTDSMRLARFAHSTRIRMEYDAVNGLSGASSLWTVVHGRRIHARVWRGPEAGPGSEVAPVVLVHGLAVSSRYFAPTAVRLARHFPVFAPDLLGWGRSDKPAGLLQLPELADAL